MTRVGTRTRVHFFHFDSDSDSDSDSEIVTRDSGPSHARVQAVAAVPCCAVYSDIRYILLFVFMFWKINKCWICGLLDSWLGLEFFFNSDSRTRTRTLRWWLGLGLGLWGDDSDSDSEVMTRTRIWQPGLGHSTASSVAHPYRHLIVVHFNFLLLPISIPIVPLKITIGISKVPSVQILTRYTEFHTPFDRLT